MVGGEIFSEPQGPEDLQNRSQPREKLRFAIGRIIRRQPVSDARECLVEKGKSRLSAVQSVSPATERGGIGHAIRIFERSRRHLFPGTMLHKAPPQRLAARQQTVVRVRKRKQRKKCEGLPAIGATTATDPDPIVVFIVRLLAAASVANDRITFASGAAPQDDFGAARGPIRFELVRRDGKWDKQNRSSSGLCPSGVDPSRSQPEAELLPPEAKNPTEREYSFSAMAI
jgi:hypothetical protein